MPQIIVTADRGEGTETWRERINASDLESEHFAAQLVERLGWAVGDAHEVERDAGRQPLTNEVTSPPATEAPTATEAPNSTEATTAPSASVAAK
jgi:hypothetical protein